LNCWTATQQIRLERIKTIHGRFQCKAPKKPPTIEFDLDVGAWYLRFSNARIAKTISEEKPGVIFAIDLDSKNEIVGLELIGVKEFSIGLLRKMRR